MSDDALLPLGIGLMGVSAMAAFMAFRPWPVVPGGSTPLGPGAYVVEVLQGKPPAASTPPDRKAEVDVIEGGLLAYLLLKMGKTAAGLLNKLPTQGGSDSSSGDDTGGDDTGGDDGGVLGDIESAAEDAGEEIPVG